MTPDSRPVDPSFEITHDTEPAESLLVGFSAFGLAGLTAVDYLVDHLDLEETGHITAAQLPSITPFNEGRPRHHTRLFSRSDLDVTVLVGELFVPLTAADPFSDAILDWAQTNNVEEISVLSGVPIPHGPDEHRVFYVATDDYRERRLGESDVAPMGNGFLDGVNAALVERGLDSPLGVGVFVTPVHPQVPDVDAAIKLVNTVNDVHDLDVDVEPLHEFSAEVSEYYRELSDRLRDVGEEEHPVDRMYM